MFFGSLKMTSKIKTMFKIKKNPVYIFAFVGILVSLIGYKFALNWEKQRIVNNFNNDAKEIILTIRKDVELDLESLEFIRSFFMASKDVDRSEFREFVAHILENYNSIQAVEWIPRINKEQRNEYVAMARSEGFTDFDIIEKNEQGLMVKSGQREEYYPVYYVEPMQGNEKAFGFDLASNQTRLESLRKARDSGKKVATARITLVQETGEQYGFLVFDPIYRHGAIVESVEQRRENLLGFALGVFRIGDMLNQMLKTVQKKNIDVYLFDESAKEGQQFLHSLRFQEENTGQGLGGVESTKDALQEQLMASQLFTVGGRSWRIQCVASQNYGLHINSGQSILILIIGILTTLFFTGYLKFHIGQTEKVEKLVEERTKDLEIGKKALEDQKLALDQHAIVAITDVSGKITYANDKFCEISKYSREELLGQDHRIINSGYHPKEFIADLWKAIAGGKVWKGEIKNKAKDGSFYWVDTTIVPFLNETGKPVQYLAIRADITDRKENEMQLKGLTEGLSRSNRDLEQFAYVASHDLQEPLRMVASFTQLLEKRYGKQLDEKAKEYINYAVDGSKRMQALIDDLLQFSRFGRKDIKVTKVDLNKVLDQIKGDLSLLIKDTNAKINYQTLPTVQADKSQMIHLFQNFITNAIKFRKEDPMIRIEHRENNDKYQFSIIDNGIGIEKKYLDKVFVIFQRLHARKDYEGTGIGLAVCKKIVENYGGKISVESEVGQGTTFHFTLKKGVSA